MTSSNPSVAEQIAALADAAGPAERARVLRELAESGAEIVAALHDALGDEDERVRAAAATGLARAGHADAATACLAAIDDAADELHIDVTPAVLALAEMGWSVAPRLLDLMLADDSTTRLHAERALELIADRAYGFVPGRGFPSEQAEDQVRALWAANGGYDYNADRQHRVEAVRRWREWLTQRTWEAP